MLPVNTSSFSKVSQPGDDFLICFFCCSTFFPPLLLWVTGGVLGGVSGWDSGGASSQRRVSRWRPLTKYSVSPPSGALQTRSQLHWVPAVGGLTPSCRKAVTGAGPTPDNLLQSNNPKKDSPFSTSQSDP